MFRCRCVCGGHAARSRCYDPPQRTVARPRLMLPRGAPSYTLAGYPLRESSAVVFGRLCPVLLNPGGGIGLAHPARLGLIKAEAGDKQVYQIGRKRLRRYLELAPAGFRLVLHTRPEFILAD